MLFLGYYIFIAVWTVLKLFGINFWWENVFISSILVYLVCLVPVIILLFFINSYQSGWLYYVDRALKIKGLRWIIFLSFIVSVGLIVVLMILKNTNGLILGLTLPYTIISFLNFMGFEFLPDYLNKKRKTTSNIINIPEIPEIEKIDARTGDIVKHYSWEYNGHSYTLELSIRREIYDELKSKPRLDFNLKDWAEEYVVNGICPEIRELAYKLSALGQPVNTYNEVEFVLNFVQSAIKYEPDIIDGKLTEYPKYPVETLVEGKGDCEDVSFLGAAILKSMGYEVALIGLPGHVAIGIAGAKNFPGTSFNFEGKEYYYMEMTNKGWKIGEFPTDFENKNIKIFPIPSLIVE